MLSLLHSAFTCSLFLLLFGAHLFGHFMCVASHFSGGWENHVCTYFLWFSLEESCGVFLYFVFFRSFFAPLFSLAGLMLLFFLPGGVAAHIYFYHLYIQAVPHLVDFRCAFSSLHFFSIYFSRRFEKRGFSPIFFDFHRHNLALFYFVFFRAFLCLGSFALAGWIFDFFSARRYSCTY